MYFTRTHFETIVAILRKIDQKFKLPVDSEIISATTYIPQFFDVSERQYLARSLFHFR